MTVEDKVEILYSLLPPHKHISRLQQTCLRLAQPAQGKKIHLRSADILMVSRKKSLDGFSFFVFIIEVSAESCRFFSFLEKNSFPLLLRRTRLACTVHDEPILAC